MSRTTKAIGLAGVLTLACVLAMRVPAAEACDVCAIYVGTTKQEQRPGPFVAIAEQFTHFGTLQLDGEEIPNFDDEYVNSSTTQLVLGYTFHRRFHMQLNLPFIVRDFRRVTETGTETDSEIGLGDLSVLARYSLLQTVIPNSVINLDVLGGLKLPSGNTARLGEEIAVPAEDALRIGPGEPPRHDGPGGEISGVHGHDLTLGTGSVDGIIGASLFASYRRMFFKSGVQYVLRTEGDFNYTFANDLQWDGGIGGYLFLRHDFTMALEAFFMGESKGKDTQNGVRLDDTAVTALYVGPRLTFTYSTRMSANIGAGLPVIQNTTSLQIVPDYRIRAALTWHF